MKEKRTGGQFRTSIGGQALIEGILMRGPKKQAIVVRSPEGLVREVEELHLIKDKYPILGWPIIRGAVTFVDSMVRGVKALMFSADYFPELEESEPSKLDRWLEAFEECGLDPHFYANRRRSEDEILPWSMISCGVAPGYLKREHALSYEGVTTPDCRTHCNACGANCLVGGKCDV